MSTLRRKGAPVEVSGTVGRRVFGGQVTLHAGGQALTFTGRDAALLADLALHMAEIRAIPFGTVYLDLTPKQAQLRVQRV